MGERESVLESLSQLNRESMRQFLMEKLQTTASRQVIEDVVQGLAASHNQDFLAEVASSITDARQLTRQLKTQLQQSQQQYQQAEVELTQLRTVLTAREEELNRSKESFSKFKESCEKIINESKRQSEKERNRLTQQLQQLQAQQNNEALQQLQSQQLANAYLREENQYLREEIMQFNERLASEQKLVAELDQQLESQKLGRIESKKVEEELNAVVEELEAVKQELQMLYGRTEEQSLEKSQLTLQIDEKDQQIVGLQRKIAQNNDILHIKDRQTTNKQQELEKLKKELQELEAQWMFKLENEMKGYQEMKKQRDEALSNQQRIQQQMILLSQLLEIKQAENKETEQQTESMIAEQRNLHQLAMNSHQELWNSTNEQLIEQQYRNSQLIDELAQIHNQLKELREKEQHYITQQNELDHIVKWMKSSNSKPERSLRYLVKKLQEEIYILKISFHQMQSSFTIRLREQHQYWQQAILDLLKIAGKNSQQPPYLGVKRQQKSQWKEYKGDRTISKGCQPNSYGIIKKTLKGIQQRYQQINQENTYYSSHLDSLLTPP